MIIRTEAELDSFIEKIKEADRWSLDTEGNKRTYPDWKLGGISASVDGKNGVYIPVGHIKGSQLSAEFVVGKLKPFFENTGKTLYMHNAKYDMEVLRLIDPSIEFDVDNIFCTMTASFTLNTNNAHGLKECTLREFGYKMVSLDEVSPKEKCKKTGDTIYLVDQTLITDIAPYAIDDAIYTFKLGELYRKKIVEEGFEKVFFELEMPFIFVLMEMEENGITVNKELLENHMEEAPRRVAEVYEEIKELLPDKYKDININSTKQLNELFFKELKLKPIGEKTKTGLYSVSADNLEVWATSNKICELIVKYRKLHKLSTTYIENMYNRVSPDGRLRCSFNRHVAATGRLSSSRPNMQNVPTKRKDVYKLRNLFIAGKGKSLIVADYSQIELRMEAHLSKDPAMIKAFKEGKDLHSLTAKAVYKLKEPLEEIKEKHPNKRTVAKTVNFGMIYESGPQTLMKNANKEIPNKKDHVTEDEMKSIMQDYFNRYPGVKRYIELCHRYAENKGFIKTITGRKRYIPEAQLNIDRSHSSQEKYEILRQKYGGFRKASNMGPQGGAADIISIAMRNIYRRVRKENLHETSKLVLQVHDELMVEVNEEHEEHVANIVREEMEGAVELLVPLVADVNIVKSWGDAK